MLLPAELGDSPAGVAAGVCTARACPLYCSTRRSLGLSEIRLRVGTVAQSHARRLMMMPARDAILENSTIRMFAGHQQTLEDSFLH